MLAIKLKIGLRDVIRIGQIVVDACSGQSMRTRAVFLCPADRAIDWYVR
jgi:hypothetical protein